MKSGRFVILFYPHFQALERWSVKFWHVLVQLLALSFVAVFQHFWLVVAAAAVVVNYTNLKADPLAVDVWTMWRIDCMLYYRCSLSVSTLGSVWNMLMKSECAANIFHSNDFQDMLGLCLEFWLRKKEYGAEDTCNNRSTAGESDNHFVWQWYNRCLYSLSTKLQKSFSNSVFTLYTE
jgi:hypothetical protein